MIDTLLAIFWGVVLLSLIVVIHEGGHFLAARACGVRVLEFMIGLPGPSVGFRRKGGQTRFGITAVPLGGYARIAGMDEWKDETNLPRAAAFLYKYGQIESKDLEEASEILDFDLEDDLLNLTEWGTVEKVKIKGHGKTAEYRFCAPADGEFALGEPRTINNPEAFIKHERSQTYIALPWWKRMVVLFAGPAANILTAIIVVTLVLTIVGTYQASTTLSDVPEGYPAYQAGVVEGDTITAIDGVEVDTWSDFSTYLASVPVGTEVALTYTHDGVSNTVNLVTVAGSSGKSIIGVTAGTDHIAYSVPDALGQSFSYIGQVTVAIAKLFNPATTAETISTSTSLIGIAVVAKEAASLGFVNFIWLAAVLSISIGLMNLLPLMPLDGGRMVVEIIQRISRKVMSLRAINLYTTVGMTFVMVLFVVVTGQDIFNLATGGFPW